MWEYFSQTELRLGRIGSIGALGLSLEYSFTLFSLASVMHLFGILAWRLKSIYASPEIKRRALDFTFNNLTEVCFLKVPLSNSAVRAWNSACSLCAATKLEKETCALPGTGHWAWPRWVGRQVSTDLCEHCFRSYPIAPSNLDIPASTQDAGFWIVCSRYLGV